MTGTEATTATGTATLARRAGGWRGAAIGMFAVAWGANQFVSLLVAYREQRGISVAVNDGLFGIYAAGLIIALILGGPAADLWGRARIVRPAVVVSLVATAVLMAGSESVALLFVGRFVAGVASGAIFAAGTSWVKELSTAPFDKDSAEDAGARRATIALSLGFGLGPLATGIVAQWGPDPLVTAYLPHLVIAAVAFPAVWRVPETVPAAPHGGPGLPARLRVPAARHPRFLGVVLPAAPWVFAGPAVAFAVLPTLVSAHISGYGIVFGGLVAGLTLTIGVLIQPLARRLDRPGDIRGATVSLAAIAAGFLVAALAAALGSPLLVLLDAPLLGVGYGVGLVSGLLETQRLAAHGDLGGLTAVYYALTYVGFAAPLALAAVSGVFGYPVLLCGLAALAVGCLLVVRVQSARHPGGTG